jgi:hypothetical protein
LSGVSTEVLGRDLVEQGDRVFLDESGKIIGRSGSDLISGEDGVTLIEGLEEDDSGERDGFWKSRKVRVGIVSEQVRVSGTVCVLVEARDGLSVRH